MSMVSRGHFGRRPADDRLLLPATATTSSSARRRRPRTPGSTGVAVPIRWRVRCAAGGHARRGRRERARDRRRRRRRSRLELLKAGAASAEVVELLPDYEPFARELAAEAGVGDADLVPAGRPRRRSRGRRTGRPRRHEQGRLLHARRDRARRNCSVAGAAALVLSFPALGLVGPGEPRRREPLLAAARAPLPGLRPSRRPRSRVPSSRTASSARPSGTARFSGVAGFERV